MKIHLATDHAGFAHKELLKNYLLEEGAEVVDHGEEVRDDNDDYPDYITPCAQAVAADQMSVGIIFGGSGVGEAMCANRINGVRAVCYYGGPAEILMLSREHNNANVLSLGARFMTEDDAIEAVKLWLSIPFSGDERHVRRLSKF